MCSRSRSRTVSKSSASSYIPSSSTASPRSLSILGQISKYHASLFYSTNYSTSSRAGRAIYWSNYKIINNSNWPSEMMTRSSGTREGELPLISISERALATKVRQQLQFSSNYESTPMFFCRMAMAGGRREKRCAAKSSQSRSRLIFIVAKIHD